MAVRGWEVVRRISSIEISVPAHLPVLLVPVLAGADVRLPVVLLSRAVGLALLMLELVFLLLLFLLLLELFLGLVKFLGRVVHLTPVTVLAGPPPVHHWRPSGLSRIFFIQSRV